jgi:hypothetical protein
MPTPPASDLVEQWFGAAFAQLHPQLQALHRHGGVLRGPVQLSFGTGLAGLVGKWLARRLGIPPQAGAATLEVRIASDAAGLHWSRRFNQGSTFDSVFQPQGSYPDGDWVERSGPIELRLQVALIDAGWHWQQRQLRVAGIALPRWLMPTMVASKQVIDGKYLFSVALRFPLLGCVLAYRGELD